MNEDTPVGRRIAAYRRRRGLTQRVLAGLVGRSESWLQKVEAGDRVIDRISVLQALANVLKVELGDLYPKFGLPPNGGTPLDPPGGVPAIERALFASPADQPIDIDTLASRVDQARRMDADGAVEQLAAALPELLLTSRLASEDDMPAAWGCLAGAYQVTASICRQIGELDLGLLVAERATGAAVRADDEALVGLSRQRVASVMLTKGWFDLSASVSSDAADALAPIDATEPEGVVWGILQLVEALAAARADDPAEARRLLRAVRSLADRAHGRNHFWESFGVANVVALESAIALELGDPVEALRVADQKVVGDLPTPERRAHFWLTTAKAHEVRGRHADAVLALLAAEEQGPEIVRYSGKAHHIAQVCLKKSTAPAVRQLAERLGITT